MRLRLNAPSSCPRGGAKGCPVPRRPHLFPHVRALAVAITAAALITQGMWLLTRDDIEQNERHKATAVLAKMYAPLEGTNWAASSLEIPAPDGSREMGAVDDATQVFVLSPWLSPAGYNGPLSPVVVAGRDARPIAVRVTSHRETPGIGDQFAHDDGRWLGQFEGMTAAQIRNANAVVNDQGFDIMTGATVTSQAIGEGVASLEFVHEFEQRYLRRR